MDFGDKFFTEVGLDKMPAAARPAFVSYARTTLEVRVGERLMSQLDAAQISEFENIIDTPNYQKRGLDWLTRHAPNYTEIFEIELKRLKADIKANSASILKTASGDSGQSLGPTPQTSGP